MSFVHWALLCVWASMVDAGVCLPWSCAAGASLLTVDSSAVYNVSVNGQAWLQNGDYAVHYGGPTGSWLSMQGGGISLSNCSVGTSTDEIGTYTFLALMWDTAAAGFQFDTVFACYPGTDLIIFQQHYPDGVASGISTYLSPDFDFDAFNISSQPTAHFPSWSATGNDAVSSLGHIEWAGEFSWHSSNWGVGLGNYVGGQLGGPLVLHSPTWARNGTAASKPQAAVLGSLANCKDAILARVNVSEQTRLVYGPQGHLDALPAGFNTILGLVAPSRTSSNNYTVYPGDSGITAAVYEYGAVLRRLGNTTRFPPAADVGVSALSYWSDNGQIYQGQYWSQNDTGGTAGDVFLNLQTNFALNGIPVRSYQLDPWWYSGSNTWEPSEEAWGPDGFQRVVDAGLNLTLYSCFWPPNNGFNQFHWVDSPKMNNFIGGPIARVTAEDSLPFHSLLMQQCVACNCVGFETDFLDFNYMAFPDGLQTAGLFESFLSGMSIAGATYGVPIQLCMPLPTDILLSASLHAVSNMRASDDNDLVYAGADRWRIGLTSMLMGAVDVRPYFDGTWTFPAYSGPNAHDVVYPPGYAQNATEMGMILATLSTGPVGIGDKLGFTNASLTRMAVASNGVILKPSLPAAPIDAYYYYDMQGGNSPLQQSEAEVYQAPSFVPMAYASNQVEVRGAERRGQARGLEAFFQPPAVRGPASLVNTFPVTTACPFMNVLVVNAADFVLHPGDITPTLSLSSGSQCAASGLAASYVAVPWAAGIPTITSRCSDGAPALDCVLPFNASGLNVSTGTAPTVKGGALPFELYSLSPVLPNGFALLGELSKFTRASPIRFSAVIGEPEGQAGPSFTVVVNGAASELVTIAILGPTAAAGSLQSSIIRVVDLQFGAEGGAIQVDCSSSTGGTVTCTSSSA